LQPQQYLLNHSLILKVPGMCGKFPRKIPLHYLKVPGTYGKFPKKKIPLWRIAMN